MATYVLIPGASSDSWYWHLVVPRLAAAGHEVVAVDLPCDDDAAGLAEYADAVVDAIGDRTGTGDRTGAGDADIVLVAQSMGAFTAPLVAERVPTRLIVLVAAMTPAPGESPGEWWEASGQQAAFQEEARRHGRDETAGDPVELFLHDVPPDVIAESSRHLRDQSGTPFEKPWPLAAWPDVPTRFLLCTEDRLFPAAFQRKVVPARLGITPDELASGHLPALAHPAELSTYLLDCWQELPREG